MNEIDNMLQGLTEIDAAGRQRRVAALRRVAQAAREKAAARRFTEALLAAVERKHPEEVKTFRAFYLDGAEHPGVRRIGRELRMDASTVYRHNRRIFDAMLPAAFGLYGVFQTDEEREVESYEAETPDIL